VKKDPKTGKALWSYSWKFTDRDRKFMDKIAGVAVHIGAYGDTAPMSPAWISHVTLTRIKGVKDHQVKQIFDEGDELHINTEDGSVLLNGRPYLEDLDISSTFFALEGGASQEIGFAPDQKCDVIMSYRPKFL
jgi:hypothetical protein